MSDNLLFGSRSLTDEEEALRRELAEWCRSKLVDGARPIPLQCALRILSDTVAEMSSADIQMMRTVREDA